MKTRWQEFLDESLLYRESYVPLELGKIFSEEKSKIGLENKEVRLVISKPPKYSDIVCSDSSCSELSMFKTILKDVWRNLQVDISACWKMSDDSYIVQISHERSGDYEKFRKVVRHELYHVKANHTELYYRVIIAIFPPLVFLREFLANRYANKTSAQPLSLSTAR